MVVTVACHVGSSLSKLRVVEEEECGAAGDRAQSAIRASVQRHTPTAPRPRPELFCDTQEGTVPHQDKPARIPPGRWCVCACAMLCEVN